MAGDDATVGAVGDVPLRHAHTLLFALRQMSVRFTRDSPSEVDPLCNGRPTALRYAWTAEDEKGASTMAQALSREAPKPATHSSEPASVSGGWRDAVQSNPPPGPAALRPDDRYAWTPEIARAVGTAPLLPTLTAHLTQVDEYGRRIVSSEAVAQFREQGVLKVTALARRSDIAQVRRLIDDVYRSQGRESGAIPNPSRLAPALRRSPVYRACLTIAKQLLGPSTGYACDCALYKEPHGLHGTPWHQDAAFHSKYSPHNTLIFWIPLQDVTPENGCMRFIPRSTTPELLPHRPFYPGDATSMMTDEADERQALSVPCGPGMRRRMGPSRSMQPLPMRPGSSGGRGPSRSRPGADAGA